MNAGTRKLRFVTDVDGEGGRQRVDATVAGVEAQPHFGHVVSQLGNVDRELFSSAIRTVKEDAVFLWVEFQKVPLFRSFGKCGFWELRWILIFERESIYIRI